MTAPRHPCPFTNEALDLIGACLPWRRYSLVLDPFAGTGRLHDLANTTEWDVGRLEVRCWSGGQLPVPCSAPPDPPETDR